MIRNFLSALLATAAVFLCVNCSGSIRRRDSAAHRTARSAWVTSISQHSNGAISRHSPVRVLFTNDVVPQERVGSGRVRQHRDLARREDARRRLPAGAKSCCGRTRVRAGHRIPDQRAREGTGRRARGHEALRIPGHDPGRELRRAHLWARSRCGPQRTHGAAGSRAHRGHRESRADRKDRHGHTRRKAGARHLEAWRTPAHGFTMRDIARKERRTGDRLRWDGEPLGCREAASKAGASRRWTNSRSRRRRPCRSTISGRSRCTSRTRSMRDRSSRATSDLSKGEFTTSISTNLTDAVCQ